MKILGKETFSWHIVISLWSGLLYKTSRLESCESCPRQQEWANHCYTFDSLTVRLFAYVVFNTAVECLLYVERILCSPFFVSFSPNNVSLVGQFRFYLVSLWCHNLQSDYNLPCVEKKDLFIVFLSSNDNGSQLFKVKACLSLYPISRALQLKK